MQHLGEQPARTPAPTSPSEPSPQASRPSDGPRALQSLPGCLNGEARRGRPAGQGLGGQVVQPT